MEEVGWWVEWLRWLQAQYWSLVQIPNTNFFLANLANFHVATILAISTYITPNILFQKGDI